MSRFFIDGGSVCGGKIIIDEPGDLHHLTKVLRCKVGQEIDVSDGSDWEYKTEISQIEKNKVVLTILDKQKFAREPNIRVTLFQGVPKGSKMETIIQKTVEMGVYNIVPVFMERTIVVEKGNFSKKLQRWQKISSEAVKQCKRGIIPEIRESLDFEEMIDELPNYDLVLCPYENEENLSIKAALKKASSQSQVENNEGDIKPIRDVAIIIGPEGGFCQEEIDSLENISLKNGDEIKIVTLGKTILRTETAGLAALAMVMYELEL